MSLDVDIYISVELGSSVNVHNERFRVLTGNDAEPDSMERDLDQTIG